MLDGRKNGLASLNAKKPGYTHDGGPASYDLSLRGRRTDPYSNPAAAATSGGCFQPAADTGSGRGGTGLWGCQVMALPPADARRAAHSAALLASDREGEVIAAARAFVGILAKGGLDPRSVVAAGLAHSVSPKLAANPMATPVYRGPWQQRARMARLSPHLNNWELGFLGDILAHGSLTQRQETCLKAILVKSEGRS